MRTSINAIVTNCNVFGFGQDRAVATRYQSCARAAQHLAHWHAEHARSRSRKFKRDVRVAMSGVGPVAAALCLAITGPGWRPVRLTSPGLVTA
jgi:hypothetical protein